MPVQATGLSSGVTAVSAGISHSCAVVNGGVQCWGSNSNGQLGNGSFTDSLVPVQATSLTSGITAVSAGGLHSCALVNGGVQCWGRNSEGQLGNGSTTRSLLPVVAIAAGSSVMTISASVNASSCAAVSGATVCWGSNSNGQLADAYTSPALIPRTTLTLITLGATSTAVATSLTPIAAGAAVTFTATVTGSSPTGTVHFKADSTTISGCGSVAVFSGAAQCTTSFATPGTKVITANYTGDANNAASTGTLSGGQVVNAVPYAVTPSAGSNGSITPSMAQTVVAGATATFMVTANSGYTAAVSGSCGGTLTGMAPNYSYTTTPVTANCTVVASFTAIITIPDAPTIGAAIAGDGLATIGFTPPANDGGSAILGYTVICNTGGFFATGTMSPLVVTGLANGTTYTCSVTAANAVGASNPSMTVSVTPQAAQLFTAVQSRKTHGTAGLFDLLIDHTKPITGAITVEPRLSGSGHKIVFQFSGVIGSVGTASVVDASVTPIGMAYASVSGNEVVVSLVGVPDNRRATVTVNGINGSGSASVSLGFLVGDVSSSRSVKANDICGIRAQIGQTTSLGNFKFDINSSGSISQADVMAAKARSGLVLP